MPERRYIRATAFERGAGFPRAARYQRVWIEAASGARPQER